MRAVLRYAVVCLGLLAGGAQALIQPGAGPGVVYTGSGATFGGTTSGGGSWVGRTFTSGGGTPGVNILDRIKLPNLPGAPEVGVQRFAPRAAVVGSAVALGAAAWGGCAAGTAIANYAGLGSGSNGSRTGCNLLDWVIDQGQPAQDLPYYEWRTSGTYLGRGTMSEEEGCDMFLPAYIASQGRGSGKYGYCEYNMYQGGTFVGRISGGRILLSGQTAKGCPASVDALNPAYSIPAGRSPGPDGLCPTGRYNTVTAAQAQARLEQYGSPALLPQLAQDTLTKGKAIAETEPMAITSVSPGTHTGRPTTKTTTKADGTVQTETRTPVSTYQPNGSTLSYSTVYNTTTQTCVGVGSCSTDTEAESVPAESEDKTDCELNPSSVGCAELGTPSEAEPVPRSNAPIAFVPVDMGDGGGSCPADKSFSVMGREYVMPMAPVCDFVTTWIRPLMLTSGAFAAALLFIGGLKT